MTIKQGRIDVHHHLIPPAFRAAMAKNGLDKVAGAPLPEWDPATSLDVMDVNGIQTALLSLSAPGVFFNSKPEAIALARECNEYAAQVKQDHPGRLGYFAVLPMPFTQEACAEAIYALDHLNADGIVLLGSTDGYFLGDARFEELMAELDRRQAAVFVHPNLHKTSEEIGLDMPGFLMEFLCDTTRAAANMVLQGVLERYPNIKWILSHAGGFIPYIAWRLSLANMFPNYNDNAPEGVMTYLKRYYYDTALSPSPFAMRALEELVEPDHILFGSDFPFAPAPITGVCTKAIDGDLFDVEKRYGVNRGNALKLFPQYCLSDEKAEPLPILEKRTFKDKLKSRAISGAVSIFDHIRNR
ncbi:MAG: amidohydrolase family protein [Pseudomonadota bacterium]|nr:amidohydrolase family protein [Pseudomonadota bacterium]